jgi:hypothetical protein
VRINEIIKKEGLEKSYEGTLIRPRYI